MAINSFKLTKLVCLGSLGCITAVSLYYHNNKDSISMEHLQQQQFRNQSIESLKFENENLRAQLGASSTSVILNCPSKGPQRKNFDWSRRSLSLYCGTEGSKPKNPFESKDLEK